MSDRNEKSTKPNPHENHRQRVKDRFLRDGLLGFEDHQALEMLLFYAVPRRDTNALAHKMIKRFGTLHNLMNQDPQVVAKECGISLNTAVLIAMIVPMFNKYSMSRIEKRQPVSNSRKAGELAIKLMQGRRLESFYVICLNSDNRLITAELLSEGTVNETVIYMRNVVEIALKYGAYSVILAHNHPSGLLSASKSDIESTEAIVKLLESVDVKVMDHVIVAGEDYLSFSEKKLMRFEGY